MILLLAGCSDGLDPKQAPSTTAMSRSPSAVVTRPSALVTPSPSAAPSSLEPTYPPAKRGVRRPAGVTPVNDLPCWPATNDAQFYQLGWYGDLVKFVVAGKPIPAKHWRSSARFLGTFREGIATSRANLRAHRVPKSYIAYRDLNELDTAMLRGITAARKRDDSHIVEIFFAVKIAQDHLVESCGALER